MFADLLDTMKLYQSKWVTAKVILICSDFLNYVYRIEAPCMHHVKTLWLASQLALKLKSASQSTEDDVASDPESPMAAEFGHANMLTCPPLDHLLALLADTDDPFPTDLPDLPKTDQWTLLNMCHSLPLTTTEFTPAMAWFALMSDERFPLLSEDDIAEIKRDLLLKKQCYG